MNLLILFWIEYVLRLNGLALCRTFGAHSLFPMLSRPYRRAYSLPPLRGSCCSLFAIGIASRIALLTARGLIHCRTHPAPSWARCDVSGTKTWTWAPCGAHSFGSVGPNRTHVLTPNAAERWVTPESFPRKTCIPWSFCDNSRNGGSVINFMECR